MLADHHDEVCRQLADRVGRRFDAIAVSVSENGTVALDEGMVRFECTIYREVEAGGQIIVLPQLRAVTDPGTGDPLVFHRSAFGRLAVTRSLVARLSANSLLASDRLSSHHWLVGGRRPRVGLTRS